MNGDSEPSYREYEGLKQRAQAAMRAQGHTVNPADIPRLERMIAERGDDWATAVIGRQYWGLRSVSTLEAKMLDLADREGLTPPLPADIAAFRAECRQREEEKEQAVKKRRAAKDSEWDAIFKAMPVTVAVAHNYESHRHCESGFVQGGDHIIVQEELKAGRLKREKYTSLCETPSYRHNLHFPFPEGDGGYRLPTCKKCIRTASKLTKQGAETLLGGR